uniref:Uncharacterized protein n=1 Tax=Arundo donax TaxID=35708 RepID=A0A0A8YJR0_ARUDO
MSGPFLQKRKTKVLYSFKVHTQSWELNVVQVVTDNARVNKLAAT